MTIPIFNTLAEAQVYVVNHPGSSAGYIAAITYDPTALLFATQAEAYVYLGDNLGAEASWPGPPPTTATSLIWPIVTLNLTQLAADLTSLRAAVANQGSFVGISASNAAPIQEALSDCLGDVSDLLGTAETNMAATTAVANVVAGGIDTVMAMGFSRYLTLATQVPDLIDMQSFLARMSDNLTAETAGGS